MKAAPSALARIFLVADLVAFGNACQRPEARRQHHRGSNRYPRFRSAKVGVSTPRNRGCCVFDTLTPHNNGKTGASCVILGFG
jgi:hypothetical protein